MNLSSKLRSHLPSNEAPRASDSPRRAAPVSLSAPRVAWPSLAVTAVALAGWLGCLALGASGALPWPLAVLGCWAAAYAAFTPLHEAAHRVVSRARWGNELVGRLAGIPLWAPLPAFRYLHLEHHKHTNEPGADPDAWSGGPLRWSLPLRWLTQDLHYYVVYLRAGRPRAELAETAATFALQAAAMAAALALGYGLELLLFGLLPSRLAIATLAFAFDWVPHRPHVVTAKQDRMRATLAIEGRLWCWLTFGQSLHLVHHLYPGVPFYRYATVWHARVKAQLAAYRAQRAAEGAGSSSGSAAGDDVSAAGA